MADSRRNLLFQWFLVFAFIAQCIAIQCNVGVANNSDWWRIVHSGLAARVYSRQNGQLIIDWFRNKKINPTLGHYAKIHSRAVIGSNDHCLIVQNW